LSKKGAVSMKKVRFAVLLLLLSTMFTTGVMAKTEKRTCEGKAFRCTTDVVYTTLKGEEHYDD